MVGCTTDKRSYFPLITAALAKGKLNTRLQETSQANQSVDPDTSLQSQCETWQYSEQLPPVDFEERYIEQHQPQAVVVNQSRPERSFYPDIGN